MTTFAETTDAQLTDAAADESSTGPSNAEVGAADASAVLIGRAHR